MPDEQAAPAETATPAKSSAITWVSAATPGRIRLVVLGRRGAPLPAMIASGAIDAILICTPHFDHTVTGSAALAADRAPIETGVVQYKVLLDTVTRGYDGNYCWVHPRAGIVPREIGRAHV